MGKKLENVCLFCFLIWPFLHGSFESVKVRDTPLKPLGKQNSIINQEIIVEGKKTETMLAITWREFDVDLHNGGFQISSQPLKIQERANSGEGTGLIVWDGSIVLAKFLEVEFCNTTLKGKKVLELGSGTGLVGLAAAILGADQVMLTDLEYTLDNIRDNVKLNQGNFVYEKVDVFELDWMKISAEDSEKQLECTDTPPATVDPLHADSQKPVQTILDRVKGTSLILAADVVWVEELISPLVLTIRKILDVADPNCLLYLSYQSRSTRADRKLFGLIKEVGLSTEELSAQRLHPEYSSKRIKIYKIFKVIA